MASHLPLAEQNSITNYGRGLGHVLKSGMTGFGIFLLFDTCMACCDVNVPSFFYICNNKYYPVSSYWSS